MLLSGTSVCCFCHEGCHQVLVINVMIQLSATISKSKRFSHNFYTFESFGLCVKAGIVCRHVHGAKVSVFFARVPFRRGGGVLGTSCECVSISFPLNFWLSSG